MAASRLSLADELADIRAEIARLQQRETRLQRLADDLPAIPVFRMHMIGDHQVPYSLALGYEEALARQGRSDTVRFAYVRRTGHCNFTNAETATAVDVLVRRIETGEWPDTTPAALEARASALCLDQPSAFADVGAYRVARYNRLWWPE